MRPRPGRSRKEPLIRVPADPPTQASRRRGVGLRLLLAAGLLAVLLGAGACRPEARQGEEAEAHPAWNRKFRGQTVTLAVDDGARLMVVGTAPDEKERGDDHVYALDGEGKVLWQEALDRRVLRVAVSGDGSLVLAALVDGTVRAWNARGEKQWEGDCAGLPIISRSADRIFCWNSGEEASGSIAIEALDRRGRQRWTFDDPGGIWDMAVDEKGDTVAALTSSGNVLVLDGRGRVLWRREIGSVVGTVAIAPGEEGPVAVGTGIERESLAVYDRGGDEIWRATVPGGSDSIALSEEGASVATGNNTILGQRVFVFDANGRLSWKLQFDRPAREPMRVRMNRAGDRVFATLEDEGLPTVFCWDGHGGVVARLRLGAEVVDYAVAGGGDRVAVITEGAKLLYYDLSAGGGAPEGGREAVSEGPGGSGGAPPAGKEGER